MKKIILGIVLSAVLVYLSLRGLRFQAVAAAIHGIRPSYVLLSLSLMLLMQVLRAIRWGGILKPIASLKR